MLTFDFTVSRKIIENSKMFNENLLYSTKAILKYLVNRGPGYQTIYSVSFDFYCYTGHYIPYVDLGFNHLVTFLQSIPDTLDVMLLLLTNFFFGVKTFSFFFFSDQSLDSRSLPGKNISSGKRHSAISILSIQKTVEHVTML